jgi:hypothetical protein
VHVVASEALRGGGSKPVGKIGVDGMESSQDQFLYGFILPNILGIMIFIIIQ